MEKRYVRRPGFVTRRVAGETVVVPVMTTAASTAPGAPQLDFVVLNESAELLWARLTEACGVPELARDLIAAYGISEEQAVTDCTAFIASLREIGAVDEVA
jgi:hypothetical protein